MSFVITKTSDHGISNPIVARLSVQPNQLMAPFFLGDEKKKKMWAILHNVVQHHLLSCYDLWIELMNREAEIVGQVNKEGIATQNHGRVASVDTLERLEFKAHSFLYSAKSALRSIKSMMIEFFVTSESKRSKLEDGDFENLKQWAIGRFGEKSDIAEAVRFDCDLWIGEIYAKRNAVEHPAGKSGILEISNFTAIQEPKTKVWKGVVPTWRRNQDPPSSITTDMMIMIENMLCFSEDLLVHCLTASETSGVPTVFFEIPEKERDPKCPIRLGVTIDRGSKIPTSSSDDVD